MQFMRYSISDTAEYGDYTRGPRLITEETRAEMRRILEEIRNGSFAREWLAENRAGRPEFERLRQIDRDHEIERVGKVLRAMMPWSQEGQGREPAAGAQGAARRPPTLRRRFPADDDAAHALREGLGRPRRRAGRARRRGRGCAGAALRRPPPGARGHLPPGLRRSCGSPGGGCAGPDLTVATVDHNVPTGDRRLPIADEISARQVAALVRNAREAGVELHDLASPSRGSCT
jgi:hypothetical protein